MAESSNVISANEDISGLRTEIIESQKARIDLLKFKLIAIATLGSIGLGFSEVSSGSMDHRLILCIIPFVCVYIDLLCHHNTMRILVIAQFLGYKKDPYENYITLLGKKNCREKRAGYYFELEDFSLSWSSIFLSMLLVLYGLVKFGNFESIFDTNVFAIAIPLFTLLCLPEHAWRFVENNKHGSRSDQVIFRWAAKKRFFEDDNGFQKNLFLALRMLVGILLLTIFVLQVYVVRLIEIKQSLFLYAGFAGVLGTLYFLESYKCRSDNLGKTANVIKTFRASKINQFSKLTLAASGFDEIRNLAIALKKQNAFFFKPLNNGLFMAAHLRAETEYTGYGNVWVRDNIHIAHAHYINGYTGIATKNINAFVEYFLKYRWRFEKIISGELDFNIPSNRPHIRFDGRSLSELNEKWSHAQNDALGYFLWLFCKLINDKAIANLSRQQSHLLALFVLYFDRIQYWQDEDNGHWEETKKIEASSIGVVVAALTELKKLVQQPGTVIQYNDKSITPDFLDDLIDKGRTSLKQILPAECIQPGRYRMYDAALLFLIFPLDVIQDENIENQILENVMQHLQGDYGIRRYIGDSYWAADYKEMIKPEHRTISVSDDMSSRDALLQPGEEAQWCIFDPIMSVIYGKKYQETRQPEYLQLQLHYFNRALAQLTPEDSPFGAYKCPELYYLEKGRYVPSDTTPLLWTQANLWVAFKFMAENAKPQ